MFESEFQIGNSDLILASCLPHSVTSRSWSTYRVAKGEAASRGLPPAAWGPIPDRRARREARAFRFDLRRCAGPVGDL